MSQYTLNLIRRMKILGNRVARIVIPSECQLQKLAIAFFILQPFSIIPGTLLSLYLFFYTTYLRYFLIIYLAWLVMDRKSCDTGGWKLECFRDWIVYRYAKDYFPAQLIKTADLDPNKNYIIGYHPHGFLAIGAFCSFSSMATSFGEKFPGIRSTIVGLEAFFMVPFLRDFLLAAGVCSVSKESIEYLLNEHETGTAIVIIVGGGAEAMDAHPKMCRLTLKHRKGFVRLAIKNGASLVPSYSFGENDLYDQVENSPGTRIRCLQYKIHKIVGIPLLPMKGRGFFKDKFGLIPYRRPINTVVGKPIDVVKNENPSEEEVSKVHETYKEELRKLFDEHKGSYGYEDQELVFA